jgi:hypothetical protein
MGVMLCPAHRVLGEAVLPFPPALAEVTLGIGRGRRVILRSYQEEESGEGVGQALGLRQPGDRRGVGPRDPGSFCACPHRQHHQSHGD